MKESFVDCLRRFIASLNALNLYKADHPSAVAAIEDLARTLRGLTETRERIAFAVGENKLRFEDEQTDANNQMFSKFALFLKRRGIAGLSVAPGFTASELIAALEVIATDPKILREQGGISKVLAAREVARLRISEIDYQRILEREGEEEGERQAAAPDAEQIWGPIVTSYLLGESLELKEGEAHHLPRLVEDPQAFHGLTKHLLDRHALISESSSPASRAKALGEAFQKLTTHILTDAPQKRGELIKILAGEVYGLDPLVRFEFLLNEIHSGEVDGGGDLINELIGQFSDSQIVEIIASATVEEKRVSKKTLKVFNRLAPKTDKKEKILSMMREQYEKLGSQGSYFLELWSVVQDLLVTDADREFMDAEYLKSLESFSEEPFPIDEDGLRDLPVKGELLDSLREDKVQAQMVDVILDIFKLEDDPNECFNTIMDLETYVEMFLCSGQYDKATNVLFTVGADSQETSPQSSFKREISTSMIRRTSSSDAVKRLIGNLQSVHSHQMAIVADLFRLLNENTAQLLIEALANGSGIARQKISYVLTEMGAKALPELVNWLTDSRRLLVQTVVEILGNIRDRRVVGLLGAQLSHPHPAVRREVVKSLGKIGGPKAHRLLMSALDHEDEDVKRLAIRILGQAASREAMRFATPQMLQIISQKNPFGRKNALFREVIRVLGSLRAEEAVPHLEQLLKRRAWFARAKNTELSMRAARALGQIGTKRAIEVLREGARDRRRVVRMACEQTINSVQAASEEQGD